MAAAAVSSTAAGSGWIEASIEDDRWIVRAGGRWEVEGALELEAALSAALPDDNIASAADSARIDVEAVETLDASGAWLLCRTHAGLAERGLKCEFTGAKPGQQGLLDRVLVTAYAPVPPALKVNPLLRMLDGLGRSTYDFFGKGRDLLTFFGLAVITGSRVLRRPSRMRMIPFFSHIEQTGLNALPIVGLLSFLIGIVLAFQGADQLARFGAEVFTVNLLGVSILRELGILMTAIIVAGRSGSAFTAQIGTMNVNQEVDAMRTLGLDPVEVLVLPRVLALCLTLPLLTIYADLVALAGGALMSLLVLDISLAQFLKQLSGAVVLTTFWVGIVKAPVFAMVIALVSCFEGLQVKGSAESVGRHTTMAVVESIFLVIVFDALFSIAFSFLGV